MKRFYRLANYRIYMCRPRLLREDIASVKYHEADDKVAQHAVPSQEIDEIHERCLQQRC